MYHARQIFLRYMSVVLSMQLHAAASSSSGSATDLTGEQTFDEIAEAVKRHASKQGSFVNKQFKRELGWQPKQVVSLQDTLLSPRLLDITALACTADGKQVVTGGTDGTVRIWTIDEDGFHTINKHDDQVVALTCTDDGSSIFSVAKDGAMHVWDTASKQSHVFCRGMYTAVACSKAGESVFVAPDYAHKRSLELRTKTLQPALAADVAVTTIAGTAAGTELFVGTSAGFSCMWDLLKQRLYQVDRKRRDPVRVLACARDGTVCVSATGGRTFQLCVLDPKVKRTHTVQDIFKVALSGNHDAPISALACTNDGKRIFSGTALGTIYESTLLMRRRIGLPIVIASTFDKSYCLVTDGSQAIRALACSSDGSRVFAVSQQGFIAWSDYRHDLAHLSSRDFALLLQVAHLLHTRPKSLKIDSSDPRWAIILRHLPYLEHERFIRLLQQDADIQSPCQE